jgi:4-carboxymuconolactone decarboxylase
VNYAWSVHVPLARKAGVSEATIEAIRDRRKPQFERDDEAAVYDLVTELVATKSLRDATFERAKKLLGRDSLIEVVSCAGFYGMVGFLLNAFDVPPQGDDVLR